MKKELYTWVERYRPSKVSEVVLPKLVRKQMRGIIKKGDLTNMLFYGNAGCGKTTCAKALAEELELDYLFINGTSCGVDTARYSFPQFASTLSLDSTKRKLIIIDEAEKMTDSFSQAFNSFVEEFAINCSFILTTNFPNQLSPALRSRFNDVCFDISTREEKKELFYEFRDKVCDILTLEGVEHDKSIIAKFIFDYFPDMRKSLNMLQAYAGENNIIDVGILSKKDGEYDKLFELIKKKNFKGMLDFVQTNELDFNSVVNFLVKNLDKFDGKSMAVVITLISDYDYRNSFAVHKKANLLAFIIKVMSDCIIP
jgi:DNA polymerase III delta prime subunit